MLKKRYEVLLRQRSQQISALQKLVLEQEEQLANKEITILDLEDEINKLKTPPQTPKKTRQRKTKVSVEKPEESTDDKSNSK